MKLWQSLQLQPWFLLGKKILTCLFGTCSFIGSHRCAPYAKPFAICIEQSVALSFELLEGLAFVSDDFTYIVCIYIILIKSTSFVEYIFWSFHYLQDFFGIIWNKLPMQKQAKFLFLKFYSSTEKDFSITGYASFSFVKEEMQETNFSASFLQDASQAVTKIRETTLSCWESLQILIRYFFLLRRRRNSHPSQLHY